MIKKGVSVITPSRFEKYKDGKVIGIPIGSRLVKIRFRPDQLATAFIKTGNVISQYALSPHCYDVSCTDMVLGFEMARNVR